MSVFASSIIVLVLDTISGLEVHDVDIISIIIFISANKNDCIVNIM